MSVNLAVILAAGEGTRMHPLTYTRPKVMLPIANKPILEHLVVEMKRAGIRRLFFVGGYHDEQVRDYFTDGTKWGVEIGYASQRSQLGTADALRMVENLVQEDFLVANGDAIINTRDIQRLSGQAGNAMSLIELKDVSGLGVVEIKEGQVTRIHEKSAAPPSHLANAGLYRFTPDIFSAIQRTPKSPRNEYEITDSIQILIDSGIPVAYQIISHWLDVSYPWDLLSANELVLASLEAECLGEIEPNAIMKGAVSVGKGTIIRSGSYIVGPAIIGQECDIGPHCFIRPSTAIGDHCHIGASVELKNSLVLSHSKVPHLSYVGDSIIGEGCNLGAGTKIANLKLDKSNIKVNGQDTGRRKLGAIIGDNVETGINASINVGTLIGNNARIGPGALAHGIIAPGSRIF
jgi:UDP-N-acetylglucosamine diphosphorylase/glucosamine-1-phosphate N-acetyltransferase